MREETAEKIVKLRSGYTTGSCATATAYAAASLLLTQKKLTCCSITLPKGKHVEFAIENYSTENNRATASTIKDAGDDPDVTHGATVFSTVELTSTKGVTLYAGDGVGMVTKPGLPIPAGEPAINPIPRKMIRDHLEKLAEQHSYNGGFKVWVGVKNGKLLATKTMNARLGILGGLSILGTTGIVRPFSCSAYIASIQQGVDVALSNGEPHLFACTGNKSEDAAVRMFSTDMVPIKEIALIEMGDFIGAVLKHIKKLDVSDTSKVPLDRLTIVGGFGKLSKFAQGHLDLHSKSSSIDLGFLANIARELGAPTDTTEKMKEANTSIEALSIANKTCSGVANKICQLGAAIAKKYMPDSVAIDVIVIDKQSQALGSWSSSSNGIT
ncbi:cobalt-precorrin-5B (C(1))-methyltransferase [Gammaproteobacteria bacterium 42_54_T18]|nr:cobalt-precorrin-5B (C(1))-methyltransferase [Gammaproteobacteria bacterium 42_54_T18]